MDIVAKGKGIWQAGAIWISEKEGLVDHFVRIETEDPLAKWVKVYSAYKDSIARQGRFLSLSLGIPAEYHALKSDVDKSGRLAHSLNVRLLLELSQLFLVKALDLQRTFRVSETKEYPLQGELEAYFNEMHSSLYEKRSKALLALEDKGATPGHEMDYERERAQLILELQRNFQDQAECLERIAKSALVAVTLSPQLSRVAQEAQALAHLCRGVETLPFERKASLWLFMLEESGLKPLLIGKPDQEDILHFIERL